MLEHKAVWFWLCEIYKKYNLYKLLFPSVQKVNTFISFEGARANIIHKSSILYISTHPYSVCTSVWIWDHYNKTFGMKSNNLYWFIVSRLLHTPFTEHVIEHNPSPIQTPKLMSFSFGNLIKIEINMQFDNFLKSQ